MASRGPLSKREAEAQRSADSAAPPQPPPPPPPAAGPGRWVLWPTVALAVVFFVYAFSLESRLSRMAGPEDLDTLYRAATALSTLRGEITELRAAVTGERPSAVPVPPGAGVPVGTVIAWPGGAADSIPDGWLVCDGRILRRSEYPELFAVIGTYYGTGGGEDTFRLPDFRGLFLRGLDDPDGPGGAEPAGRDPDLAERIDPETGEIVGARVGTLQGHATAPPRSPFILELGGEHSHTVLWSREGGGGIDDVRHAFESSTNRYGVTTIPHQHDPRRPQADGAHTHVIDPESGDAETRPANAAVNWLIRAAGG